MPSLLWLLSYVGAFAAFLFVTLSLASGLLWLAELIEEHSKYAKYVGMRAIYAVIVIHILLIYTDSLPALPTLFSVACHLVYLSNFTPSWPFISLTSPRFIASCILVIADHFTWFFHFANKANEAKRRAPRYSYGTTSTRVKGEHGFMEVSAFFGLCVWLVPLFLFLSLSANDNALPSMAPASPSAVDLNSPSVNGGQYAKRGPIASTSLIKSLLVPVVSLLPRLRRRKRDDEGILAPRTPIRGSPLHTPVNMSAGGGGYFPWGAEGGGSGSHTGGSRSHSPAPLQTSLSSSGFSSASGSRSASGSQAGGAGGSGGGGGGPGSGFGFGFTGNPSSTLSPESAKAQAPYNISTRPSGGPPPPRRVQSEAQISAGSTNPRGIATRNGRPVVPDSMLPDAEGGGWGGLAGGEEEGGRARGSSSSFAASPISMSLGPMGVDKVGGAEVVDSMSKGGLTRRKAD